MQAGKRSNQSSSKNNTRKGSDRVRNGLPKATEVVGRRERLEEDDDDDDDDDEDGVRSYPKTKKRMVILEEDDDIGNESDEGDEDEQTVARTQANSVATTRPPLVPRNRRPESEPETSQNELQEKYQKVKCTLVVCLL